MHRYPVSPLSPIGLAIGTLANKQMLGFEIRDVMICFAPDRSLGLATEHLALEGNT